MTFPQASRLTTEHDVVLVGYRGVDGSRRLDCPEVTGALHANGDLTGSEAQRAVSMAFAVCAQRLSRRGVDLTGYSVTQRVDDIEAARTALRDSAGQGLLVAGVRDDHRIVAAIHGPVLIGPDGTPAAIIPALGSNSRRRTGLTSDLDTVTAGLTLPHSSGPVEGNVNRNKTIKRQMYGRAGFDLLRERVLLAS
jgi:hypothetical protein